MTKRVKQQGSLMNNPELMLNLLKLSVHDLEHEIFGIVFADTNLRYITHEELFRGSLLFTAVSPREVVKACLKHNASRVVLYHNHPTGSTTPSPSDISITRILTNILHVVDVQVVDHFILVGDKHFSFLENEIMPKGGDFK
jgi:DNA repair protein RadC